MRNFPGNHSQTVPPLGPAPRDRPWIRRATPVSETSLATKSPQLPKALLHSSWLAFCPELPLCWCAVLLLTFVVMSTERKNLPYCMYCKVTLLSDDELTLLRGNKTKNEHDQPLAHHTITQGCRLRPVLDVPGPFTYKNAASHT